MKTFFYLTIILIGTALTSCSTPEDKALKVVDNFLSQANDEIEGNLDTTLIRKFSEQNPYNRSTLYP